MHQKRSEITTKLPLPRKGTTYVARASSHIQDSVPVVVAIRDMLGLAKTAREVKEMIKAGLLKINGKRVKDFHESIRLLNVFEADKVYVLSILPTKKFVFKEADKKDQRVCKVIDKRLVKGGKVQLNLHDGTNILSSGEAKVGDSIYVDFSGKVKSVVKLDKGKKVFIISGKYSGLEGKVESVEGKEVIVSLDDRKIELDNSRVVAL